MIRDTILLFTSMKEPVSALSDEDAGKLLKAILAYQTGEPVNLEGLLNAVFISIRQQIDYNNQAYEDRVALRSEAGKKGAEARWQKMANDSKRIAKDGKRINAIKNGCDSMANDSIYVNDNENVLTNECITAHTRTREDAAISDDDFVTTTDGRQIPLKDLTFPEKIKIGFAQPSDDITILGHKKLTEEEKERMRKRAEEFASGVRRG